jgi:hypothetical protein
MDGLRGLPGISIRGPPGKDGIPGLPGMDGRKVGPPGAPGTAGAFRISSAVQSDIFKEENTDTLTFNTKFDVRGKLIVNLYLKDPVSKKYYSSGYGELDAAFGYHFTASKRGDMDLMITFPILPSKPSFIDGDKLLLNVVIFYIDCPLIY